MHLIQAGKGANRGAVGSDVDLVRTVWMPLMAIDPAQVRMALGRNLTYGMLDHIGKAIVTGAYEGSPFPTEAELSKQHGVSRSVTREAVKMLTAKGLLSARPRQGTIVQPTRQWNLFDPDVLRWLLDRTFSIDLLTQFSQLRVAIEPAAAALAAKAADLTGVELIRAGYERMCAADRGEDDTLESDIAFHVAILRASANPFFAQFRDVVSTALRTSIRYTNQIKGRAADLSAHGEVLEAIVRKDADAAQRAMRTIISDVVELISEHRMKTDFPSQRSDPKTSEYDD